MALGGADTTTAAGTLKYIYRKKGLESILYKASPVLGMITKINDYTGNGTLFHTVQHGGQQGVSLTLTTAIANQSSSLFQQFSLARADVYGTGKIAGKLIRASKDDNGSLLRSLKNEQNNLLLAMQRHMSNFLFGNGGGAFGQVGSFTGTTITLADPTQAIWFEKDMLLQHATTDGTSGALADAGATLQITKVDRRQGILTFSATGPWATLANNDYVFVNGNFGQANVVPMGISGWIPITEPTSTAFFGVDRTVDPSRLGGLRYLASAGGSIVEVLQNAMAFFYQEGATPDTLIMNPVDVQKLIVALGAKATAPLQTTRKGTTATGEEIKVGYNGVKLISPFGEIEVFADPACQVNRAYFLDMSTWELHWMGDEFPMFLEEDGLMMRADATTDNYVWRMGAHYNVLCTAPGKNGVAQLQLGG